ncbi:MAG: phosphate ABC transporter permease PstA [Dehalococcoidia bacterium]
MATAERAPLGRPTSLRATGRVALRQAMSRSAAWLLLAATLSGLLVLAYLAYDVIQLGGSRVFHNFPDFFTTYPSRFELRAGIRSPILGTLWVLGLTIVMTIPIAVGTAIWLEEFAPRNRLTSALRLNISNLAGVPSIIYGILGLAVFARAFGLGGTVLTGALTLSLMILPMTVIAAAEAIRQVPPSIRDASLALGATKWQTVWSHVLPGAIPGIMTGIILAVSRAAGETAALIMIGAYAFVAFDPASVNDAFTVLPIQIYEWTLRPGETFKGEAAAAIIVAMVFILSLNLMAVLIRERFRQR